MEFIHETQFGKLRVFCIYLAVCKPSFSPMFCWLRGQVWENCSISNTVVFFRESRNGWHSWIQDFDWKSCDLAHSLNAGIFFQSIASVSFWDKDPNNSKYLLPGNRLNIQPSPKIAAKVAVPSQEKHSTVDNLFLIRGWSCWQPVCWHSFVQLKTGRAVSFLGSDPVFRWNCCL